MSRKTHPFGLDIFFLGKSISELELTLTFKSECSWSYIKGILETISKFKNYFSIGFIGKDAQRIIEYVGKDYPDASKSLAAIDIGYIKESTAEWMGSIFEISDKWVFCVSRASLDSTRLMDGIASFLNKEELSMLEPKERQGLDESAGCLLHNSFTSAEFTALRTVESLLRRWYKNKTDKDLKRQRWGDILNELNDIYPKISERPKELYLLDYLRLRRNEIDHPEAISTPDEASATFLNTISVCKAVKSVLITKQPQ